MFGQEIHGLGGLFQIVQLRPMGEACAPLCLDVILDINEQADLSLSLIHIFLVLKPKQGKKVPADLDDFDLEDEEEYLTEDEETEEKNE